MPDKVSSFQHKILTYYSEKGRDLPWRKTTDPYSIWISEVMLQQTKVDRVIDYFKRWLAKWPTVHDLAKAYRTEVLTMWMGLGYNNRAVKLHEAAKTISTTFKGDVIAAMISEQKIAGIGPYTKSAVRIFAANHDVVTVDTNIRRILIHEFALDEKMSDKELWVIAEKCLPHGKSRDWHNALMDYGATLLTARKTGIKPKTRQSKFEGSDRQIRAKMLRHLLVSPQGASFDELVDVGNDKNESERVKKILEKMAGEGLVVLSGKMWALNK